jgi:hypothetical protein
MYFLSRLNDPKIVTERLKKDIIKLVTKPIWPESGTNPEVEPLVHYGAGTRK